MTEAAVENPDTVAPEGPAWARRIARWLNEGTMGLLALSSVFLGLVPLALPQTPDVVLVVGEMTIVGLFAVEYLVGLRLAEDRRAFLTGPWRILDAVIIVTALVALLPGLSDVLRNTPALRLLRVVRVALLGTRSTVGLRTTDRVVSAAARGNVNPSALALRLTPPHAFESVSWEEAMHRARRSTPDWLLLSDVGESGTADVAAALGLSPALVARMFAASFPRYDRVGHYSALFVWLPYFDAASGTIQRLPLLLIGTADNIVVLCRESGLLLERIVQQMEAAPPLPAQALATWALINAIVVAYREIAEQFEARVAALEAGDVALGDDAFLRYTFELRAGIVRARRNLKHLSTVLGDIVGQSTLLADLDEDERDRFAELAQEAEGLYENVDDVRDELGAVVDMRINVASFQMNRVMRLLALLTALALIPATAGGLLGMNLADNPWPLTLPQVAFGIGTAMSLALYVFATKGWFR